MANDSAVVNEFPDHKEYEKGSKRYILHDVGCVTMWGERCGNQLIRHLAEGQLSSASSLQALAIEVNRYLTEEYRPHETPLPDTGYHVAGLDEDGKPTIYHIFWNISTGQGLDAQTGSYAFQHYRPEKPFILHNGRNELANLVVSALNIELRRNNLTKFPFNLLGICQFTHLCLRFGAEVTDDIAPPFQFFVKLPGEEGVAFEFSDTKVVDSDYFAAQLEHS